MAQTSEETISVVIDPEIAALLGFLEKTELWWRHSHSISPQMAELLVIRRTAIYLEWDPDRKAEFTTELDELLKCAKPGALYRYRACKPTERLAIGSSEVIAWKAVQVKIDGSSPLHLKEIASRYTPK